MKKDVVISIYDHDGDLVEQVHREMDVHELTDLMLDCLKNEGIPVVRMENEAVNGVTKDWAPGLSFHVKIGNIEIDVSGQPKESKMMYGRILEDLHHLVKISNGEVEEIQNAMKELNTMLRALKR